MHATHLSGAHKAHTASHTHNPAATDDFKLHDNYDYKYQDLVNPVDSTDSRA